MTYEGIPFEINWNMTVLRAIIIKQLSKAQLEELHKIEDSTAKNFIKDMQETYKKDNPEIDKQKFFERPYLLMPFNIQKLFFKDINESIIKNVDSKQKRTIIILISQEIPKGVEADITQYTSVKWQHSWDWNIFHSRGFEIEKPKPKQEQERYR